MRSYPIDADRVKLISTGTAATPLPMWVALADGSRRPDPNGRQDVHEVSGLPLWRVEAIAPADESDDRDRTGVVEIIVASQDVPVVGSFGDLLAFEGLVMTPGYVNKKGVLTAPRWSADGIRQGRGSRKNAPAHEGEQAA